MGNMEGTVRNKYSGKCYQCGDTVKVGDGYFQRYKGGWRVHHVSCCHKARDEKAQQIPTDGVQKDEQK